MPILVVHGVATRRNGEAYAGFADLEQYLRRFIAPAISAKPEEVPITPVYWGELGVRLAWNGLSRPRSLITSAGASSVTSEVNQALVAAEVPDVFADLPATDGALGAIGSVAPMGVGGGSTDSPPPRLKDLTQRQLSELLGAVIRQRSPDDPALRAQVIMAADNLAYDEATGPILASAPDAETELAQLIELLNDRFAAEKAPGPLTSQGAGAPSDWFQNLGDYLGETLRRGSSLPGFVASVVATEARRPLNELLTRFFGDVFVYLKGRGTADAPGEIPKAILAALKTAAEQQRQRGGEPIIVLTHSMGGQIIYDIVTYFLPNNASYAGIRIDFWCATASQVGLFEEMKLFLVSDEKRYSLAKGNKVPFPDRAYLGVWWNVWDSNDFISFTAKEIFEGLEDEEYSNGSSALSAHGGYLDQPSFYRRFAQQIVEAKAHNWRRP